MSSIDVPEQDDASVEAKQLQLKRSFVWNFFERKNPTHATCILCMKQVAHSGGTTNLRAHLTVSHEHLSIARKRKNTTSESSEESTAGGESPLRKKRLTSKSRLPRIDEAFEKQNSFAPGGTQADKITNAIVYMVCKDKEPLNIVEKKGFQYLMKTTAPHYTLPSRKALTKLVDDRYIQSKDSYICLLQNALSYTLTCDNWTDVTFQSYLGVTIHCLTEDLKLESSCLGVFPLDKNHTTNYLTECLEVIIADFKLDNNKIMAITSDGAANIRAAVQNIVGPDRRIWCFAHFISHLVPKVLKEMGTVTQLIDTVRQFVAPFKKSIVAADELKKLQIDDGKTEGTAKKFKTDCPTRWNSQYYMLERFLQLEEYLPGVIRKCRKEMFPSPLTHNQIEVLQELVDLMRPVESVIKEISGSEYPTCSVIIPIVSCLINVLQRMKPLTSEGIIFKRQLLEKIKEKFDGVEEHKLLAIATILDPRFKKLHFNRALAVASAVEKINKEMKSVGVRVIQEKKANVRKIEDPATFSLWKSHDELVEKTTDDATNDEHLSHELRQYLKESPIARYEDPLKHWKSLRPAFPTLYELAIRYISIIGTSVPSERIFSEAGYVKTLQRNRLTGEHVNRFLFLGDLPWEAWKLS